MYTVCKWVLNINNKINNYRNKLIFFIVDSKKQKRKKLYKHDITYDGMNPFNIEQDIFYYI